MRRDQNVLVRGDRILDAGHLHRVPVPSGARVVDGRGLGHVADAAQAGGAVRRWKDAGAGFIKTCTRLGREAFPAIVSVSREAARAVRAPPAPGRCPRRGRCAP